MDPICRCRGWSVYELNATCEHAFPEGLAHIVAGLVPISEKGSTLGSVTLLTDDNDKSFSIGEAWNAP
jgi:hypothetical protein